MNSSISQRRFQGHPGHPEGGASQETRLRGVQRQGGHDQLCRVSRQTLFWMNSFFQFGPSVSEKTSRGTKQLTEISVDVS